MLAFIPEKNKVELGKVLRDCQLLMRRVTLDPL